MKKLSSFFAFIIISLNAFSQQTDFRKAHWKMSIDSVKLSETKKPVYEVQSALAYTDKVAGKDAFILYIFSNNKLSGASYAFKEKYSNENQYISDFEEIKGILTEKYGKPVKDDIIWSKDLFRDRRDEWGTALALGYVKFKARWENDRTLVILELQGNRSDIGLSCTYGSKELKGEITDEVKKKNQEDF